MTTYISPDDCKASVDAWESSLDAFFGSVSSARAAGRYSTITFTNTITSFDYSIAAYTPQNETNIRITSFPMAPRTSIWIETLTSILEPEQSDEAEYPNCIEPISPPSPCDPKNCTISAQKVQLFYWPVSTVSGYSNLTVTLNATEPVTAVVNGTTFTSPTIYLSYDQVSAMNDCKQTVGKLHPGALLSLNQNAISSIRSIHQPANTFNFADLNKPYSPDVILQMCWPEPSEYCYVGIDDIYNPRLVVPEEIRVLDPAWKDCAPDWLGSYDPPRILVPAQVLVQPSSAADNVEATSLPATPAHTVRPQRAASTTKLDAEMITSTSLTSPTKSRSGNEMPVTSSSSKISSVIAPPNQSLPALDPPDQKTYVKNTPAASYSVNEASSKNLPGQNKNQPTNAMSAPDLPSVDSLPLNDPTDALPSITVESQGFTADPASHDINQNLTPGGEITVSGTPINVPPLRLSVGNSPHSLPVIVIESQSFTANSISQYIINSQTLNPDGQITVSGTPISAPKAIFTPKPTLPPIVIGFKTYNANSASQYIISSQTFTPDGEIFVPGTPVSLLPVFPSASAIAIGSLTKTWVPAFTSPTPLSPKALELVVGGTTEALVSIFSLPPLTIASQTYTMDSNSQYIIASQTLTPNGKIVVSGTTISLLPSASALVIGSITRTLKPTFALPPLVLGSKTYRADSASRYIVNDQTLSPGGHITMSGTLISLASEPSAFGSKGNLEPLFSHFDSELPAFTIDSKIYTANGASAYVINDQTLTLGGQMSVDGNLISLIPKASALEFVKTAETLHKSFALPPITVGSIVYTADSTSAYVIKGQTLTPGGQVTVDGTPISVALDDSVLVIGSSTQNLVAASTKIGLGQLIIEGFGNRVSGNGGSNASNEGRESSALAASDEVAGSNRVTGVSLTNLTSGMSTPVTNPTQTTAVFARGVSRKGSPKMFGFGAVLSTIFMTLV